MEETGVPVRLLYPSAQLPRELRPAVLYSLVVARMGKADGLSISGCLRESIVYVTPLLVSAISLSL